MLDRCGELARLGVMERMEGRELIMYAGKFDNAEFVPDDPEEVQKAEAAVEAGANPEDLSYGAHLLYTFPSGNRLELWHGHEGYYFGAMPLEEPR